MNSKAEAPPSLVSVKLHQPIEECPPLINGFHADALVQTVDVSRVRILEEAVDPVRRDAGGVQELGVRCEGQE